MGMARKTLHLLAVSLLAVACASFRPGESGPPPTNTVALATRTESSGIELPQAWTATLTPPPTITRTPKPTATGTAAPAPTWMPCEESPSSQLHEGDTAIVNQAPFLPKELRDSPSAESGDVIGTLNPLEEIEILTGPVCAEGLVWWEIESVERSVDGWIPEGDEANEWIALAP